MFQTDKSLTIKAAIGFGVVLAVSVFTSKFITRCKKRKKIIRIIDTIEEFRKSTVKIKDPDRVEEIVCNLIKGGVSKLQVISDFDHTITRTHFQNGLCGSTHNMIESSALIPDESRRLSKLLFDKYYPIEIDPKLSINEKIPLMIEWYSKSHELVVNSGIRNTDFANLVESSDAMLRDGCDVLFDTLNDHGIPLLIFSAGLGDLVQELLKHCNCLFPNIKIIANFMKFDEQGNIVGFEGDLIHMYNKNHGFLRKNNYFEKLGEKTNVILLGDSLGDVTMAEGLPETANILRIGFLNKKIDESLKTYKDNYDIVLTDDQTMDVVNGILRKIL